LNAARHRRPPLTYAIVWNGFADGPAQALRDYLVEREANVVTIVHPLTPEQGALHVIATYADGKRRDERTVRLPLVAPYSYALDPFVPLLPPSVDAWFGFNPLACGRGLMARAVGRARRVLLWSVDFVPDRFGPGTLATRIYDRIDRFCCLHADTRIELSEAARAGRNERHHLPADSSAAHIVPMGAWVDRVPTTPPDGFERRRVVFLGHLVPRQGVARLFELGEDVAVDVIGTGPLEPELRRIAPDSVTFHGYVDDHRDVERLLAQSSVAVAPYERTDETFTRFADPGKLKAYLAAGLPIVMTGVPPNAQELAREAGAEVVEPSDLAAAVRRALASPESWRARRGAALGYVRRFEWSTLLGDLLAKLDLSPAPKPTR
jgi:glycosyltransferase involved in cell wall biosynthesis